MQHDTIAESYIDSTIVLQKYPICSMIVLQKAHVETFCNNTTCANHHNMCIFRSSAFRG